MEKGPSRPPSPEVEILEIDLTSGDSDLQIESSPEIEILDVDLTSGSGDGRPTSTSRTPAVIDLTQNEEEVTSDPHIESLKFSYVLNTSLRRRSTQSRRSKTLALTKVALLFQGALHTESGRLDKEFDKMIENTSNKLALRKSHIHGFGVFATDLIQKNDFIVEYTGEKISHQEANLRESSYEKSGILLTFLYTLDENWVLDATLDSGNTMAKRINHSCEPNCYASVIHVRDNNRIIIQALKDIRPGAELTTDYRYSTDSQKPPEVCLCKKGSCRKLI